MTFKYVRTFARSATVARRRAERKGYKVLHLKQLTHSRKYANEYRMRVLLPKKGSK